MASPSKDQRLLQPLTTHWQHHNRSHSSIPSVSDAATFHTSHMELHPMTQTNSNTRPTSPQKTLPSPKLEAIQMSRHDSGFSDTPTPQSPVSSSRRTSISNSSARPSKPNRRTHGSTSSTASRPSTKHATRSSPSAAQVRLSTSSRRPSLQTRHTTPYRRFPSQQPYQFFQFPSLSDWQPDPDTVVAPPPPLPPPATVQYWTSDQTRRLEYAAIDAASRGVRGFFIKLVPDCILPASRRRTKFCEGDEGSDAGSVRRYRLTLPEEKEGACSSHRECPKTSLLRRWTAFGGRKNSRS